MRTFLFAAVSGFVLLISGCAGPAPEYRNAATVKDIMDSIVDPNADFIWDSVSTSVTAKGIEEKMPKTNDDWKELRRHTIALMEATDLLQIPGRLVARPGEKAENPQVELSPEVIKTLIDSDRRAWIDFAHGLHDATAKILKAVDTKDVAAVLDAGDGIDKACENCHKQYWYPERAKK